MTRTSAGSLALTVALLAAPVYSQLKPGTFLAALKGTAAASGIFTVDRFANTSARMSIVGMPGNGVAPVRTLIEDPNNFLVLTQGGGAAHVFRVTWSNGAWRARQLTTPKSPPPDTGMNIARVGNWVYVARGTGGGNTARDGEIWRVPAGGGDATRYLALGPSVVGTPQAMVAVGTVLHVFMWDGPSTLGGAHVAVDTAATVPAYSRRGRLPFTKSFPCRRLSVLPTQVCVDPVSGLLVIGSRSNDIIWRTTQGTVIRHESVQTMTCPTPPRTQWGDSFAINTDTGALLCGDADGGLEEKVCLDGSWRLNVQTIPGLPAETSIRGLEYHASGSLYQHAGPGCGQSNGQRPCNYVNSLPTLGNTGFAMTVETPSRTGLLMLGAGLVNIDLTSAGAPGCALGAAPQVILIGQKTAAGLAVSFAVPPSLPVGVTAYTQWAVEDKLANACGVVFSDTRRIKP